MMTADAQPKTSELFPLIRHLSARVTPLLLRLPVTANQISYLSLLVGLCAAWCVTYGTGQMDVVASALLVTCYVLDNCDGEVARAKNQASEYGRRLDNFVDWAVHTALFAGLGFGVAAARSETLWLWLGAIAALGSTINYTIGTIAEEREAKQRLDASPANPDGTTTTAMPAPARRPENWRQWIMFAFRELSRADFCFIVLLLSISGGTWLLLPFGAIGAQAFWAVHLVPGAREYHV